MHLDYSAKVNSITKRLLYFLIFSFTLLSCTKVPNSQYFYSSQELPEYNQESFEQYIVETKKWISENRVFLTENHGLEVNLNIPFELKTAENIDKKRGILFVHGLGASPWYFMDISKELAKNGWLVRAISLPGHGTRPADLSLPEYKDWEQTLQHHVNLISKEVDELWLAGFSTGANIVTAYAMDNTHVSGLLLFSPGFYPRNFLLRFSPLFSFFSDWIDIDEEDNIFCYQSLHVNASLLYYTSVKKLQKKIHARVFDKPALIVISQHDSVINTDDVVKLFQSKFTNKSSRLIWYGTKLEHKDKRIELYNSRIPHKKISTFSHMNILFSNTNEYFGENGKQLMLENGQKNIPVPSDRSELWFGAWGYTEKDKFHARLTWNPYFTELINEINKITNH